MFSIILDHIRINSWERPLGVFFFLRYRDIPIVYLDLYRYIYIQIYSQSFKKTSQSVTIEIEGYIKERSKKPSVTVLSLHYIFVSKNNTIKGWKYSTMWTIAVYGIILNTDMDVTCRRIPLHVLLIGSFEQLIELTVISF